MNDDYNNNKFPLIFMVLIVAACIIGPVLIWQSDMPTWLKWLLTK